MNRSYGQRIGDILDMLQGMNEMHKEVIALMRDLLSQIKELESRIDALDDQGQP